MYQSEIKDEQDGLDQLIYPSQTFSSSKPEAVYYSLKFEETELTDVNKQKLFRASVANLPQHVDQKKQDVKEVGAE